MNIYDYLVIGFYFVFMVGIGFVFKRFNHNISDYFRGGGTMLWWLSGASAVMGGLSVWSFTGAAARAYEGGTFMLIIYGMSPMMWLILALFNSYRFRQMRVVTSVEGIHRRYGRTTEQFYVWIQIPLGIIYGAIGLNTLGVFLSTVFGTPLISTIVLMGVVIIFVATCGGAWAVIAGDFVQMVIMLLVCSVVVFLCLQSPEIGGIQGFIDKTPKAHWDWTEFCRGEVIVFFIAGIFLQAVMMGGDLYTAAPRFLTVKDGDNARKAAWMGFFCSFIIPALVLVPPMCGAVLIPNLASLYPQLPMPQEAAFAAVCLKLLPHGLVGLLVSAIFAVAMAGLDTALNRNSGIFIRNFYGPILRPQASESELFRASKWFTVVFGVLVIGSGVLIAIYRNINLFDFVNVVGSLLGIPLIVPMFYGTFIKKTPSWAGWSTALIGFITAVILRWGVNFQSLATVFGWSPDLTKQEVIDFTFGVTVIVVFVVTSLWYFGIKIFYKNESESAKARVESLFLDMETPIDPIKEKIVYDDFRQYQVLGILCKIYGGAMLLGILIPNSLLHRSLFLFVGGVIFILGWTLSWYGKSTSSSNTPG